MLQVNPSNQQSQETPRAFDQISKLITLYGQIQCVLNNFQFPDKSYWFLLPHIYHPSRDVLSASFVKLILEMTVFKDLFFWKENLKKEVHLNWIDLWEQKSLKRQKQNENSTLHKLRQTSRLCLTVVWKSTFVLTSISEILFCNQDKTQDNYFIRVIYTILWLQHFTRRFTDVSQSLSKPNSN